jgi:hypothetical protein
MVCQSHLARILSTSFLLLKYWVFFCLYSLSHNYFSNVKIMWIYWEREREREREREGERERERERERESIIELWRLSGLAQIGLPPPSSPGLTPQGQEGQEKRMSRSFQCKLTKILPSVKLNTWLGRNTEVIKPTCQCPNYQSSMLLSLCAFTSSWVG